jgi:hypothetical protein
MLQIQLNRIRHNKIKLQMRIRQTQQAPIIKLPIKLIKIQLIQPTLAIYQQKSNRYSLQIASRIVSFTLIDLIGIIVR